MTANQVTVDPAKDSKVYKFSNRFMGRLCLRVDAAVCIADLSVGCMHDPPQGIMGGV